MGLTDDQKRGYERTIIPGFQEDLTLLENVSIESIEKVLKGRFMNDNIYTAVGPLLFSINPYRFGICFGNHLAALICHSCIHSFTQPNIALLCFFTGQ
jgi:myosin heavy subunit